ncbi:MAG: hypothetical protein E7414_05410 [Ruminococcaceae bacterium]|nr:hypothetical protein [Oscillospiraceae bacterium]
MPREKEFFRDAVADIVESTGKRVLGVNDIKKYLRVGHNKAVIIVPPFYYMTGEIDPLYSYDRIKGDGETVMKHYVAEHLVEATDEERRIDGFVIADNKSRGLGDVAWQAKFTKLSEELKNIGQYAGLGWRVEFEPSTQKFYFDVVEGIDRTAEQALVPPVIFCREFKNISSTAYTDDQLTSINTLYTASGGEEEEQYVDKVGGGIGILRREGTTSISSDDVTEVRSHGEAYLQENGPKESVEAVDGGRLSYRSDWDLGDYVTVRTEIAGEIIAFDKQVTEVQESYDIEGVKIEPTFGEKKESIIKKIRRSQ